MMPSWRDEPLFLRKVEGPPARVSHSWRRMHAHMSQWPGQGPSLLPLSYFPTRACMSHETTKARQPTQPIFNYSNHTYTFTVGMHVLIINPQDSNNINSKHFFATARYSYSNHIVIIIPSDTHSLVIFITLKKQSNLFDYCNITTLIYTDYARY